MKTPVISNNTVCQSSNDKNRILLSLLPRYINNLHRHRTGYQLPASLDGCELFSIDDDSLLVVGDVVTTQHDDVRPRIQV
jgi:hypothetical protein